MVVLLTLLRVLPCILRADIWSSATAHSVFANMTKDRIHLQPLGAVDQLRDERRRDRSQKHRHEDHHHRYRARVCFRDAPSCLYAFSLSLFGGPFRVCCVCLDASPPPCREEFDVLYTRRPRRHASPGATPRPCREELDVPRARIPRGQGFPRFGSRMRFCVAGCCGGPRQHATYDTATSFHHENCHSFCTRSRSNSVRAASVPTCR